MASYSRTSTGGRSFGGSNPKSSSRTSSSSSSSTSSSSSSSGGKTIYLHSLANQQTGLIKGGASGGRSSVQMASSSSQLQAAQQQASQQLEQQRIAQYNQRMSQYIPATQQQMQQRTAQQITSTQLQQRQQNLYGIVPMTRTLISQPDTIYSSDQYMTPTTAYSNSLFNKSTTTNMTPIPYSIQSTLNKSYQNQKNGKDNLWSDTILISKPIMSKATNILNSSKDIITGTKTYKGAVNLKNKIFGFSESTKLKEYEYQTSPIMMTPTKSYGTSPFSPVAAKLEYSKQKKEYDIQKQMETETRFTQIVLDKYNKKQQEQRQGEVDIFSKKEGITQIDSNLFAARQEEQLNKDIFKKGEEFNLLLSQRATTINTKGVNEFEKEQTNLLKGYNTFEEFKKTKYKESPYEQVSRRSGEITSFIGKEGANIIRTTSPTKAFQAEFLTGETAKKYPQPSLFIENIYGKVESAEKRVDPVTRVLGGGTIKVGLGFIKEAYEKPGKTIAVTGAFGGVAYKVGEVPFLIGLTGTTAIAAPKGQRLQMAAGTLGLLGLGAAAYEGGGFLFSKTPRTIKGIGGIVGGEVKYKSWFDQPIKTTKTGGEFRTNLIETRKTENTPAPFRPTQDHFDITKFTSGRAKQVAMSRPLNRVPNLIEFFKEYNKDIISTSSNIQITEGSIPITKPKPEKPTTIFKYKRKLGGLETIKAGVKKVEPTALVTEIIKPSGKKIMVENIYGDTTVITTTLKGSKVSNVIKYTKGKKVAEFNIKRQPKAEKILPSAVLNKKPTLDITYPKEISITKYTTFKNKIQPKAKQVLSISEKTQTNSVKQLAERKRIIDIDQQSGNINIKGRIIQRSTREKLSVSEPSKLTKRVNILDTTLDLKSGIKTTKLSTQSTTPKLYKTPIKVKKGIIKNTDVETSNIAVRIAEVDTPTQLRNIDMIQSLELQKGKLNQQLKESSRTKGVFFLVEQKPSKPVTFKPTTAKAPKKMNWLQQKMFNYKFDNFKKGYINEVKKALTKVDSMKPIRPGGSMKEFGQTMDRLSPKISNRKQQTSGNSVLTFEEQPSQTFASERKDILLKKEVQVEIISAPELKDTFSTRFDLTQTPKTRLTQGVYPSYKPFTKTYSKNNLRQQPTQTLGIRTSQLTKPQTNLKTKDIGSLKISEINNISTRTINNIGVGSIVSQEQFQEQISRQTLRVKSKVSTTTDIGGIDSLGIGKPNLGFDFGEVKPKKIIPPILPLFKFYEPDQPKYKKKIRTKRRTKYMPSIEAQLRGIYSKRQPSKMGVALGLDIRPIVR